MLWVAHHTLGDVNDEDFLIGETVEPYAFRSLGSSVGVCSYARCCIDILFIFNSSDSP